MKPPTSRKRAVIGDVLEISTPAGLAYFQYTHQHSMYGGLIRVLEGTYGERPADFAAMTRSRECFVVFFPVRAAANRGLVKIVAHEEIPPHAREFPLFKSGRPGSWWLWDGEREWRIGELAPDQRSLPFREIWNDTLLAKRIANGWSPADESVAPS